MKCAPTSARCGARCWHCDIRGIRDRQDSDFRALIDRQDRQLYWLFGVYLAGTAAILARYGARVPTGCERRLIHCDWINVMIGLLVGFLIAWFVVATVLAGLCR